MEKIYNRVADLLNGQIPVWMYLPDGREIEIASILQKETDFFCKDEDGNEYEMSEDEESYSTINYSAKLFH